MAHSNLESFLRCTTPAVRSQLLPKTSVRDWSQRWQPFGSRDNIEYFTLEDLWDYYDEWSAYGAGAPMYLSDHKTVVQYYTPFLSGIQIYTAKSASLRNMRENSCLEVETDSTSSDSEGGKLSRSNSYSSNRTWDLGDSGTEQDVDFKVKERFGDLYLQYFDNTAPHLRLPLKDTTNKLAEEYPGLNSLRSIDLSPASWMAIAWYPIYHIPAQRNPKELYSAFLTYHTLSSSFQDNLSIEMVNQVSFTDVKSREVRIKEDSDTISLPPFGLAAYRMQRHVWVNPKTQDCQRLTSLLSSAASWLMQHEVDHPDFNFFVSRPM
uniref:Peptide deformylase n=1 Tax=Anthurium amnicola TaxID=1678845 RepID=A0A1D1YEA7_9ARAE